MSTIGLFEAKTHLSSLARRVAAGEEVVVTDRGRPVMKLVPIEAVPDDAPGVLKQQIEALRLRAVAWRQAQGQPPLTLGEALSFRDEGRH